MSLRVSAVCAVWSLALAGPIAAADRPVDDEFFEQHVRPLLVRRCYECHSGTTTKGGLSLETQSGWQKGGESGPALVPGQPDASLLLKAIRYQDLEMPPQDRGGPLPESEVAILEQWIAGGAPDPRSESARLGGMSLEAARTWWAFQPLPLPDPTPTAQRIDEFLQEPFVRLGLTAAATADRRTLLRRATYDLTGLPPTPEEVEAFLADDSPEAFARAVDRLLASPQYGVHWGRRWLDVVRYADTAGENTDRPLPHAWRYRNWVFDAFNRDLPYDEFVRLQIAGDLWHAAPDDPRRSEGIIATGYLAIARRFGHDIDKDIHLMHEDVIDNLGKNFLGLTAGCARCHDHKYDPITTQDYYALYGILNSSRFSFSGCEAKGQPRDLVPLLPEGEVEALLRPWREASEHIAAERKRRDEALAQVSTTIREQSAQASRTLAAGVVGEGATVSFAEANRLPLDHIAVRAGDVLQLTVLPNTGHGADSTLVEWNIAEVGGARREWQTDDLVKDLFAANPHPTVDGAAWCFLEATNGPVYLTEQRTALGGHPALKAWSLGSEPSVFVNESAEPAAVWTTLPARSFFVHPGPNRPVALAWISPLDGEVAIKGRVADAHPAGLDGVAFQLDHLAAPEIGRALDDLGRTSFTRIEEPPPAPVIPVAYAVVDSAVAPAREHLRGDPEKLGEEIPRRWLSVLGGDLVPPDAGSGRWQLANWIASQPLAARVIVNRVWQGHMGQGLVRTPNDFGARGEPPTHPELLDWLAAEFVAQRYSLKSLHRFVMNTAAYQRSSVATESAVSLDPENRYLSHADRRRLTAEELRDSLLLAAGRLDPTPAEAHPFPPESTWTFTQHTPFNAVYETTRRSAYLMVQRQRRHPFLALFDGADPNASTAVRQSTTVPTQALYFLNDPFFHEQAAAVAARLLMLPDDESRIAAAGRSLLQRKLSDAEQERAWLFVAGYPGSAEERWAAYVRVLMASNEFLHLD